MKAASRPAVLENLREIFKTFLSMFEFGVTVEDGEVNNIAMMACSPLNELQVESAMIGAFMEVVVKLNETAFRPIFRKMFDWAFAEGMLGFTPKGFTSERYSRERYTPVCQEKSGVLPYLRRFA